MPKKTEKFATVGEALAVGRHAVRAMEEDPILKFCAPRYENLPLPVGALLILTLGDLERTHLRPPLLPTVKDLQRAMGVARASAKELKVGSLCIMAIPPMVRVTLLDKTIGLFVGDKDLGIFPHLRDLKAAEAMLRDALKGHGEMSYNVYASPVLASDRKSYIIRGRLS